MPVHLSVYLVPHRHFLSFDTVSPLARRTRGVAILRPRTNILMTMIAPSAFQSLSQLLRFLPARHGSERAQPTQPSRQGLRPLLVGKRG